MIRTTQDDSRENEQIRIFKLQPYKGRSNKYIPDAYVNIDDNKYDLELKTRDIKKSGVSTSRDFGKEKIEQWKKNDGFVFSSYEKKKTGFVFHEHVFCTAGQLKPFFDKQEKKQQDGHAGRIGRQKYNEIIRPLLLKNEDAKKLIEKLDKTINQGTKINDPKISWKDIKKWGTILDNDRLPEHLLELLKEQNK